MKIVITVEVPDGADVAVGTEAVPAAPAKAKGKAKAATESAPPAAAGAPAATAPATAAPAPEAPTVGIKAVNDKVSVLAGLDRDAAVKILVAHGAATVKTSTSQLKPEVYQVVIDETEEAIDRFNAAAVQVANTGSLV